MPKILYLLYFAFTIELYIIETDKGNLYACDFQETILVDNIHDITASKINRINSIPQLFPPIGNTEIAFTGKKLQNSNKIFFDHLYLNNYGRLCFYKDEKIFYLNFTIFDVIKEPKIINKIIFTASINTNLHRFPYTFKNMLIDSKIFLFIKSITLHINDGIYDKDLLYNYVYSPFDRENVIISFEGNEIKIDEDVYNIRDVEGKIINVYGLEMRGTNYFMVNLHRNTSLLLYESHNGEKSHIAFIVLIMVFIFVITYKFFNLKKLKNEFLVLQKIIEEKDGYVIRRGKFDSGKVIVKTYAEGDPRIDLESEILKNYCNPGLVKYFCKEVRKKKVHLVFEEYFDLARTLSKKEIHSIVKTVYFLHKNKIIHGNICIENIKLSKGGGIILTNFSEAEYLKMLPEEYKAAKKTIKNKKNVDHDQKEKENIKDSDKELKNGYINSEMLNNKDLPIKEKGTLGWRSPEIIIANNNLMELTDESKYKSEIFSLGILFYYNINKQFPFDDDKSTIEANTLTGNYNLEYIEDHSLHDLICNSITKKFSERLNIKKIVNHPYFWSNSKKFNFLADLSDFIEFQSENGKRVYLRLERNKSKAFSMQWNNYIDKIFEKEILNYKTYNFNNMRSLLRAIRNKGRHFNELPENIKQMFGSFPKGYINYFERVYPSLIMVCHYSAVCCAETEQLKRYYDMEMNEKDS